MFGVNERPAGPPTAGEPAFLVVGKVRRPHGVHGEVVAEIYTDFPEQLIPKKAIFVGEKHLKLVIANLRQHREGLLLSFEGISSPEQAGRYRNQIISISASEAIELPGGRFYFHELLDLEVVDERGNYLGRLIEILETGANDVYVVKATTGRELLLPAIREVVLSVDLDAKKMRVHLIPGLRDENGEN